MHTGARPPANQVIEDSFQFRRHSSLFRCGLASVLLHLAAVSWIAPRFFHLADSRESGRDRSSRHAPIAFKLAPPSKPEQAANIRPPSHDDGAENKDDGNTAPRIAAAIPVETVPVNSRNNGNAGKKPTAHFFYSDRSLSRRPELLEDISPIVELSEGDEAGSAVFRVAVTRTGAVASIKTIHSSLPGEVEKNVLAQLSAAVFRPGEIDGRAVDSETYLLFEIGAP